QASSPVSDTVAGRPSRSSITSEQVASNARPAIASPETPDALSALRVASQTARQISSELCSAWSGAGRLIEKPCSARASRLPRASNKPARALVEPTSTPRTTASVLATARRSLRRQQRLHALRDRGDRLLWALAA